MDSVSLDPTALSQLHGEQKALLDAIDNLRKHGIDRFVDLPQIIVVGDQSSGKSSVLEAISRVRFPVKDGLCTRFATELVLRTDSRTKVDVQILPSETSKKGAHSFQEKSFDKEELPRIIEDAKKVVLRDDPGFSEDVLRIEISGPDIPHLTLVDLPGFYHAHGEHQSAAGRDVVDRLVERYMARNNSIILAVVSARNSVVMQKVLGKVQQHDKKKERTLGVITKPDTLSSGSKDEEDFVRLAKNLDKSNELSLGWHVLRNRGEAETSDTDEQRDDRERDFFKSGLWSGLPSKNRGVESLRKKLSGILLGHIKHSLPSLISSIEDSVSDRKTRLDRLGEPRSTIKELRMHLSKIASQFHILCSRAIEGNYADEFFGGLDIGIMDSDNKTQKFRALTRNFNRSFAYILETRGSRRILLRKDEFARSVPPVALPRPVEIIISKYVFQRPQSVKFEDVTSELEELSAYNQGNEFPGTSNDRLAVKLFQDQSRPWEAIARRHIELVSHYAKVFVEQLLDYIINPDKDTYVTILSDIVDPFFEKVSSLLESKLQELLYHYKSGHPQPLDSEFRSLLTQRRQKNPDTDALRHLVTSRPELFSEEGRTEFRFGGLSKRQSEFGVEDVIDKAETYYEMSLRTFTDNVIVLAIENVLIKDLPSIFTTERVNQMEDEELERLASESPEVQMDRQELEKELDDLKKGLKICNKFKQRESTHQVTPPISSDSARPLSTKPPPAKSSAATDMPFRTSIKDAFSSSDSSSIPSQSSTPTFPLTGNPSTSSVVFGSLKAPETGTKSMFGSSFGTPPKSFGSTPSPFGNSTSSFGTGSSGVFGTSSGSGFGGFGASTSTPRPAFGSSTPESGVKATSLFNTTPNKTDKTDTCANSPTSLSLCYEPLLPTRTNRSGCLGLDWSPLKGTLAPSVRPRQEQYNAGGHVEIFQNICASSPYDKFSPEELRCLYDDFKINFFSVK
ncbi:P-loop containing nucleoside triphosphate hydrolase protein [Hypoxylon sp. FL1150]|nr:P-loop containing nucleoside triphosphate hydrolase protein [Hypoxylon sp. FL1150]